MIILLLEPNRLLANQYKGYLENEGHKVIWKLNAQTGIGAADEQKPDVVIVELLLAGHSGVEFLYEFRSYSDWVNVPVILMSSVVQSAAGLSDGALQELGVNAYLYKPELSLEQLGRTLKLLVPSKQKRLKS